MVWQIAKVFISLCLCCCCCCRYRLCCEPLSKRQSFFISIVDAMMDQLKRLFTQNSISLFSDWLERGERYWESERAEEWRWTKQQIIRRRVMHGPLTTRASRARGCLWARPMSNLICWKSNWKSASRTAVARRYSTSEWATVRTMASIWKSMRHRWRRCNRWLPHSTPIASNCGSVRQTKASQDSIWFGSTWIEVISWKSGTLRLWYPRLWCGLIGVCSFQSGGCWQCRRR